jgi:hypothetical protein
MNRFYDSIDHVRAHHADRLASQSGHGKHSQKTDRRSTLSSAQKQLERLNLVLTDLPSVTQPARVKRHVRTAVDDSADVFSHMSGQYIHEQRHERHSARLRKHWPRDTSHAVAIGHLDRPMHRDRQSVSLSTDMSRTRTAITPFTQKRVVM